MIVTSTSEKGTVNVHLPEGWTFDPERWARAVRPLADALEKAKQEKPAA